MTVFFIIEGADCVGKSTFIKRFQAHCQRPLRITSEIQTMDPILRDELQEVVRTGIVSNNFPVLELACLRLEQAQREIKESEPVSVAVATVASATTENAEFTRKIHAGELSQKEIADAYLQVNYDHYNAAIKLGLTHDIVLLDRALPSYYALQLHTMGFTEHEANWHKLIELTQENKFTLVYLSAPEDVIQERAKAKRGESVLDEIYGARLSKVLEGYEKLIGLDIFSDLIRVDVTATEDDAYVPYFEAMLDRARYTDPMVLEALVQSRLAA